MKVYGWIILQLQSLLHDLPLERDSEFERHMRNLSFGYEVLRSGLKLIKDLIKGIILCWPLRTTDLPWFDKEKCCEKTCMLKFWDILIFLLHVILCNHYLSLFSVQQSFVLQRTAASADYFISVAACSPPSSCIWILKCGALGKLQVTSVQLVFRGDTLLLSPSHTTDKFVF